MNILFKPATRTAVKLKLGITGPSGSGKTFGALRLARGLVGATGRIAFVDTENGSASLYADRFAFDVINMTAPFTVQKFEAAIAAAQEAGYDALILDSITAEWQELLAEKEALDARGGNSYTNWASITKKHEAFKKAFIQAPIHIVACMRAKQEYVLQANEKGKQAPVKVGMGAVQREGFEYECSVVFDVAMDHNAAVSKDRSSLFDGQLFMLTEEVGKKLRAWLDQGGELMPEPQVPEVAQARPTPTSGTQQTPDPEWVSAMAELAEVTVGMPEKTRKALVESFEKDGPSALEALRAEIATIRGTMRAPEPENPQQAFHEQVSEALAGKVGAPVSEQELWDAVAGVPPLQSGDSALTESKEPGEPPAVVVINEYEHRELEAWLKKHKVDREHFRAYAQHRGALVGGDHLTNLRQTAWLAITANPKATLQNLKNFTPAAPAA